MKLTKKENDAVSPVIGVMLMLVVTIIIAALVSTFSSGLAETTSATPQAAFSISFDKNATGANLISILHKGGDSIDPADLKISMESYGAVKTYDVTSTGFSTTPATGPLSTGSKITIKTTDYYSGKVTWSIIDKATSAKICSGTTVV